MFLELKVYDHGLSPLPMQNPYSRLILAIKSLFINRCSTYYEKCSANYWSENILHPSQLKTNYLRKFMFVSKNQHIRSETDWKRLNMPLLTKVEKIYALAVILIGFPLDIHST